MRAEMGSGEWEVVTLVGKARFSHCTKNFLRARMTAVFFEKTLRFGAKLAQSLYRNEIEMG